MPPAVRYSRLPTERANPRSRDLDRLSIASLLRLMNREDLRAVHAVQRQIPRIARAIRLITQALRGGGRLLFVGAGTSGRLGVIEAAECPTTFSTAPALVQAVIAGGRSSVFRSKEGAEDDRLGARRAVRRRVRRGDVVVGIAASGVTPFVDEALRAAARLHAHTILITCHPRATARATIRIALDVGPEVLTGSTRLKAGTATKLVLNMLTLGTMVQCGKTYGNLMVDVRPSSRKLRERALRIIQSLGGCTRYDARHYLLASRDRVPVAVLMARRRLSYSDAIRQLTRANGSLRRALEN